MKKAIRENKRTLGALRKAPEKWLRELSSYSTTSHGGYHLEPALNEKVAPAQKQSTS